MEGDALSAFMSIAQIPEKEAQGYLGAAGGDLQQALSLYFADNGSSNIGPFEGSKKEHTSAPRKVQGSSAAHRSFVTTINDLANDDNGGGSGRYGGGTSDSDDDPARLFTGGEKSGLEVQNPDHNSRGGPSGARKLVDAILDQARRGAPSADSESLSDADSEPSADTKPVFRGRGFRLGDELSTETVPNAREISEENEGLERVRRTMIFWRNGFSIDDGPLYAFDDPRNVEYLETINRGRAPVQLLNVRPNQAVDVRIDQRPDEDYVAPKRIPAFETSGEGQRLGGASVASTSSSSTPPVAVDPVAVQAPQDGDAPVQLRLADGSVYRARFHSAGTLQQLYDFVDQLSGGRAYTLQTTFPPSPLTNRSQSVSDAGIKGAVVVQRWV